jgi:hypothetical protein
MDNSGTMSTPRLPSRDPLPQLFRFTLRQLFLLVTLVSLVCGALALVGGTWSVVIGIGALLVGAHVLGNYIGTRLRDETPESER